MAEKLDDLPLELEDEPESAGTVTGYFSSLKDNLAVLAWVISIMKTPVIVRWFQATVFFVLVATGIKIIFPYLFSQAATSAAERDLNMIIVFGLCGVATLISEVVFTFYRRIARERVQGLCFKRLDEKMAELFLEKSVGQHQRDGSKLSVANIDKGRNRTVAIQNVMMFEFMPSAAILVFALFALSLQSWLCGLIMLGVVISHVGYSIVLNNWLRDKADRLDAAWRARNRYLFNRLRYVERVKTSAVEHEEERHMDTWFGNILKHDYALWSYYLASIMYRELLANVGLLLTFMWGGYLVYTGEWKASELISVSIWAWWVHDNIWQIGEIEHQVNYNLPATKSMRRVLSASPDVKDAPDAVELTPGPVGIEFSNVSYSYEKAQADADGGHTLSGISFVIRPGSKTAIVGPSGAGKTSIMRLMLRNMDPSSGEITSNGVPLQRIKRVSWLKAIGYIPQKDQIFDGTLRTNLTYGLEFGEDRLTDEEIWKVIRPLQVDFGSRLDKGLDTEVGENGLKLSGGQAQRVMIAAAVMRKPRLLIVDEATSSLDPTNVRKVQEGLMEVLGRGITAVIISHNLSTIRPMVDQIIVLRPSGDVPPGGSQIEYIAKNFEDAYKHSPTFRELADDQGVVINAMAA